LNDPGQRHPSCIGGHETPFFWHSPVGSAKQPELFIVS
jgi:hypothetical protein